MKIFITKNSILFSLFTILLTASCIQGMSITIKNTTGRDSYITQEHPLPFSIYDQPIKTLASNETLVLTDKNIPFNFLGRNAYLNFTNNKFGFGEKRLRLNLGIETNLSFAELMHIDYKGIEPIYKRLAAVCYGMADKKSLQDKTPPINVLINLIGDRLEQSTLEKSNQ